MIRGKIYSNDRKTFELVEKEDEMRIILHSVWEALHFVGLGLALWRFKKQFQPAQRAVEKIEEAEAGKPVYVQWKSLKFRIN